jgi:hypothetical protein
MEFLQKEDLAEKKKTGRSTTIPSFLPDTRRHAPHRRLVRRGTRRDRRAAREVLDVRRARPGRRRGLAARGLGELDVGAVAERRVLGGLAHADRTLAVGLGGVGERREPRVLARVRAVAHALGVLGAPAAAPVDNLALGQVNHHGAQLGRDGGLARHDGKFVSGKVVWFSKSKREMRLKFFCFLLSNLFDITLSFFFFLKKIPGAKNAHGARPPSRWTNILFFFFFLFSFHSSSIAKVFSFFLRFFLID